MSVIVMVHRHLYVWRISWKILTTQKMASHDLSWISVRLSMVLGEGGIARPEGKFPVRNLCVFIYQPTCFIDIIILIIIVWFLMNFSNSLTIILSSSLLFYFPPTSYLRVPVFHFSSSQLFPFYCFSSHFSTMVFFYTFLLSAVILVYALIFEDFELGISDGRQCEIFVFLHLDFLIQQNLF